MKSELVLVYNFTQTILKESPMKSICVIGVVLLSISRVSADDWLLVPHERAGDIHRAMSDNEIRGIFAPGEARHEEIHLGEGVTTPGLVVFPDDDLRRIEVIFKTDQTRGRTVRIRGRESNWHFGNGVTLGTTLKELEALNGKPFRLAGCCFDGSGSITSWDGGSLEDVLPMGEGVRKVWIMMDLSANTSSLLTDEEQRDILGGAHSSNDSMMQKLNPEVYQIRVQLVE
jgi:hypothetical protein